MRVAEHETVVGGGRVVEAVDDLRDPISPRIAGALQLAQLDHDLLDDVGCPGGLRAIARLVGPDMIERAAASDAPALHCDEPAKAAGAAQPRGGRRSVAHDDRPEGPAKSAMSQLLIVRRTHGQHHELDGSLRSCRCPQRLGCNRQYGLSDAAINAPHPRAADRAFYSAPRSTSQRWRSGLTAPMAS